jgi:hypothetical protein
LVLAAQMIADGGLFFVGIPARRRLRDVMAQNA